MKPTLSIALITLGLTFPAPALAVDYLQCEAMERTATRIRRSLPRVEAAAQADAKHAQIREQCGVTVMGDPCPGSVVLDQQRLEREVAAAMERQRATLNKVTQDMRSGGCV